MDWRAKLDDLPLTRRQLIAGAALGGGLAVAWWLWPRHYSSPLAPGPNERDFGGWITIGTDGVVTVAVPQLEMGQGVTTVLAQVVAVELGADWRQVAVEPAPPSGLYANIPLAAKWAQMWSNLPSFASDPESSLAENFARSNAFIATAEGSSLIAYEAPLREAAASARAMLAMAAAERWDIDWEECEVAGGLVRYGEQSFGFGTLVTEAAEFDPPDPQGRRPRTRALRRRNSPPNTRASTCQPRSTGVSSSQATSACLGWSTPRSATGRSAIPTSCASMPTPSPAFAASSGW